MAPRERRRIAVERVARAAHKAGIAFVADRLRESSSAIFGREMTRLYSFAGPRNKMMAR